MTWIVAKYLEKIHNFPDDMEVEIEMTTPLSDVTEILEKVSKLTAL